MFGSAPGAGIRKAHHEPRHVTARSEATKQPRSAKPLDSPRGTTTGIASLLHSEQETRSPPHLAGGGRRSGRTLPANSHPAPRWRKRLWNGRSYIVRLVCPPGGAEHGPATLISFLTVSTGKSGSG